MLEVVKAAVIGILLLFVGIFAAVQVYEYTEKKATEKAQKAYTEYLTEREEFGDTLDTAKFMKSLKERKVKAVLSKKEV